MQNHTNTSATSISHDQTELEGLLRLMTEILRNFADLADDRIDTGINAALGSIGAFCGVDRSYLFTVDPDEIMIHNTHEWCAPGIAPEIDNLRQVEFQHIYWWQPRLKRGEAIYIPDISALPDERSEERKLLGAQHIQSLIVVPLLGPDRLRGFIGFDSVRHARVWSHAAILLLRAVADIIVGGLRRHETFESLAHNEERFRSLVRHSADVVMITGPNTTFHYLGPSALAILGWEAGQRPGGRYLDAVHPDDLERVLFALEGVVRSVATRIPDHRLRHASGVWRWFQATAIDLSQDRAVGGIVINAHDITLRKEAEDALLHQALHDPLTQLPNRALLMDRLKRALARTRQRQQRLGVVFLDVDRFKTVNDALGHSYGDQLLVQVAERLQAIIGEADTIARFGGDEFVALLEQRASGTDGLVDAANGLLGAFAQPFLIDQREHLITASAGLVIVDGSETMEEVLRDADAAMYQAKEKGRACLQRFDAPLQARLIEQLELTRELRGSEQRGELKLLYQPIFNLHSETMCGVEALIRWHHPVRGLISPATFIPIAEESGLILPIGQWVLEEAMRQMRAWLDQGLGYCEFHVAVNLSAHQLADPQLRNKITHCLQRYRIEPHQLCLELTESALMGEPDSGMAVLNQLRRLGVLLAIDDFGTGYSSLAYLRDMPVNILKVDHSFVDVMTRTNRDLRVVAVITSLARELDMTIVAEGVENAAQMTLLRQLKCETVQGFYLLRPMTAEALTALWQRTQGTLSLKSLHAD